MPYFSKDYVTKIRQDLKNQFVGWKFSVTGGNSHQLKVHLLESPLNLNVDNYFVGICLSDIKDIAVRLSFIKIADICNARYDNNSKRSYVYDQDMMSLNVGRWDKPYIMNDKLKMYDTYISELHCTTSYASILLPDNIREIIFDYNPREINLYFTSEPLEHEVNELLASDFVKDVNSIYYRGHLENLPTRYLAVKQDYLNRLDNTKKSVLRENEEQSFRDAQYNKLCTVVEEFQLTNTLDKAIPLTVLVKYSDLNSLVSDCLYSFGEFNEICSETKDISDSYCKTEIVVFFSDGGEHSLRLDLCSSCSSYAVHVSHMKAQMSDPKSKEYYYSQEQYLLERDFYLNYDSNYCLSSLN